jgi:hypothetical protein
MRAQAGAYPPEPQIARVIALGNLRGAPAPSKTEVALSRFLFGAEPTPPLTIANPAGLAGSAECVFVCDSALGIVFRWDTSSGQLGEVREHPSFEHPFAIDIAPGGELLVCDNRGALRCDSHDTVQRSYRLDSEEFKPAGVLTVGDSVWVSNTGQHRIEVFDTLTAQHRRSIGQAGSRPGQFAAPRGMARMTDGSVCVVDMLNHRVQVLDPEGGWLRDIGRLGAGSLGRPRDVAVGPDGTVFVTDAFTQRVHAFTPDGQPLLTFGEPGSGVGELILPSGIAVITVAPQADHELRSDCRPAYYVLVSEQMSRPGVRVYAWLGYDEPDIDVTLPHETVRAPRRGVSEEALGPHWDSESCAACHEEDDDERPLPIASDEVAELCSDCHEAHEEEPFLHVVDGEAGGEGLRIPSSWPLVDGELGCLTCHDIKQQCDPDARRAGATTKMLRRYDPSQARSLCTACHVDPAWGGGPHRQLVGDGQVDAQACLFCHEEPPAVPSTGVRQFDAKLRDASGSCWSCHTEHWDWYPARHVDQLVPPEIHRRMLAAEAERRPTRLPLAAGRIACYTCHNPHQVGLFPAGSELATWAASPTEAAHMLRADRPQLCLECHEE